MHAAEEPHSTEERSIRWRRKRNTVSPFLQTQQNLQKELHCDYVILWYERDANSPPGKRPNYLPVGEPIPVSLSHQVFMQMALGVLKDRLNISDQTEKKDKDASEDGVTDNLSSTSDVKLNSTGAHEKLCFERKNISTSREEDVVALFFFLWKYVASMLESQAEALKLARAQEKSNITPRPTIRMTKQQLRLQMLLEYGVDVQQVVGNGLPITAETGKTYCQRYLTSSVSEEEFYNQLAKPSGMAQECSMM